MSQEWQGAASSAPGDPQHVAPRVPLRPTGAPPAARVAILLALLLLVLAAVLVRDVLVITGAVSGDPWTSSALRSVDGLQPQSWMVPAGVVVTLVGLWVVLTALRPRPRPDIELGTSGAIWVDRSDTARLAQTAATTADGVLDARATATRRGVRVTVTTTAEDVKPVAADVRSQVERALAELSPTPSVSVKASTTGGVS
ncbi:hypothetical protein GCM10009867_19210 [Pedococcus aerophilus]|uniref:DUF6286 domain-containing protein n=1 Tax=Pedococcus aerophilus TaxID=436356 RepID=A0ABN3UN94_9MICO